MVKVTYESDCESMNNRNSSDSYDSTNGNANYGESTAHSFLVFCNSYNKHESILLLITLYYESNNLNYDTTPNIYEITISKSFLLEKHLKLE